MTSYTLTLSADEARVLFDFFHRFDETDKIEFAHAAEYVALQHLAGQIDQTTPAVFDPDYKSLLEAARNRVSDGFEGELPG